MAPLGARRGGGSRRGEARQGHQRVRLGEANAMEGSPSRNVDGKEKLDGGGADFDEFGGGAAEYGELAARASREACGRGQKLFKGAGEPRFACGSETERRRGCPVRFGREVEGGSDGWGPPVSGWRWEQGCGRCCSAAAGLAREMGHVAHSGKRGDGRGAGAGPGRCPFFFLFQKQIASPIFFLVSKQKPSATKHKINQAKTNAAA